MTFHYDTRPLFIITRGISGSGKSTFLKDNGLDSFSICPDNIRLLFSQPSFNLDGEFSISIDFDKQVWDFVFDLIKKRMHRKEFIIIDGTHLTNGSIKPYKELVLKNNYRTICIDFTELPFETNVSRNENRDPLKKLPLSSLNKMLHSSKNIDKNILNWIEFLSPNDFLDFFFEPNIVDLSSYKEVVHIGDIQGCNTVLQSFLNNDLDDDKFYIFLGDYVDRGIENHLVLEFLFSIMNKPNVIFLEGNHEIHPKIWSENSVSRSREFENKTKKQLDENRVSKKLYSEFYKKLNTYFFYSFNGKEVFCSHAGFHNLPNSLFKLQKSDFVRGVGGYSTNIDKMFTDNFNDSSLYQVHGHRNKIPSQNNLYKHSINLESSVEFGFDLSVALLNHSSDEFIIKRFKNNVFSSKEESLDVFLEELRTENSILEKVQEADPNISSFNFKRKVFYDSSWTDINSKARGLFINTTSKQIVARSYDKFFNLNEKPETTLDSLEKNLTFPCFSFIKENGFLGILGFDFMSDNLIYASKKYMDSYHSKIFQSITENFLSKVSIDFAKNYLNTKECSFVFEVIDPINDPHIIDYDNCEIILLDIIHRSPNFKRKDYEEVKRVAKILGVPYKKKSGVFKNFEELSSWISLIKNNNNISHEGFVIEDSNNFMFKIKSNYYSSWKNKRRIVERLLNNLPIEKYLFTEEDVQFSNWFIKNQDKYSSLVSDKVDIILLRKDFLNQ